MIELNETQRGLIEAMLAQVALVVLLLAMLPFPRIVAGRRRQVKRSEDGRLVFPKWATQLGDCINNQFQVPTLFYVACILALWLHLENPRMVLIAWGFVAARWAHAAVFITTNTIPVRLGFFAVSLILAASIWLQIAHAVVGF